LDFNSFSFSSFFVCERLCWSFEFVSSLIQGTGGGGDHQPYSVNTTDCKLEISKRLRQQAHVLIQSCRLCGSLGAGLLAKRGAVFFEFVRADIFPLVVFFWAHQPGQYIGGLWQWGKLRWTTSFQAVRPKKSRSSMARSSVPSLSRAMEGCPQTFLAIIAHTCAIVAKERARIWRRVKLGGKERQAKRKKRHSEGQNCERDGARTGIGAPPHHE